MIDVHVPERLANGAIRGRVYHFGPGGLLDIGGYKIAADGTVAAFPDALRGALPGTQRSSQTSPSTEACA